MNTTADLPTIAAPKFNAAQRTIESRVETSIPGIFLTISTTHPHSPSSRMSRNPVQVPLPPTWAKAAASYLHTQSGQGTGAHASNGSHHPQSEVQPLWPQSPRAPLLSHPHNPDCTPATQGFFLPLKQAKLVLYLDLERPSLDLGIPTPTPTP